MARRYRMFICKRRYREGQIIQNTPAAKREFEDIKRDVFFGLKNATPEMPVFLMNTYPTYRMAESLILPELFHPLAHVGIARRLSNGRGYRVVACVINHRLLPSRTGHVYPFGEMRNLQDVLATMEKIQRNAVSGAHASPWSVLGIDKGSPGGDVTIAARGFVTAKGVEFVSFDMVAYPFPEAVCKEKKDGA